MSIPDPWHLPPSPKDAEIAGVTVQALSHFKGLREPLKFWATGSSGEKVPLEIPATTGSDSHHTTPPESLSPLALLGLDPSA